MPSPAVLLNLIPQLKPAEIRLQITQAVGAFMRLYGRST
jgi:hypothetical protein